MSERDQPSEAPIHQWLRCRARATARDHLCLSLIAITLSAAVFFITILFFLGIVPLLLQGPTLGVRGTVLGAVGMVLLLFLLNHVTPRYHPADSGLGSLEMDLVLCGPRLAQTALDDFRKCRRLVHLDIDSSATVLSILLQRGRKVSCADLALFLPLETARRAFSDLQDLEGVVKLHANPVGLSLTEELRKELRSVVDPKARSASANQVLEEEAPPSPTPSPEHKLFGLHQAATLEEIKAAYRLRMKQYHPDRYSDRGEEWRKWAEEKTKALNAAYETLVANHDSTRNRAA